MNNDPVITNRLKLGYGIASLGDTAIYNLLVVYLLFFLTDVAKVPPVTAGAIILVSTAWNAVFIGAIGYISDKVAFHNQRRLPFMRASILPMTVFTVLMFTEINGPDWIRTIYYMMINSILWTMHSMYVIPYEALGAEIVKNTKGRTILRSYARFFQTIGNLFGLVVILYLIEFFKGCGLSAEISWPLASFIIAIISGLSCCITNRELKEFGIQPIQNQRQMRKEYHLISEYFQVIRLGPFKYLLAVTLFFCISYIFFSSDVLYFMKYNLGLSEKIKPFVFLALTISGVVMTPIISELSKCFDKKHVMMVGFIVTGIGMSILGFVGISSFPVLCLYISIFTIGASSYWQLMYSIVYDISEVDEWKYGKRREGIIISSSKIFLRISTALSVQLLAFVLYCYGYNGDYQTQSLRALQGIKISLTYIPSFFFFISALCIYLYPLSREKHEELLFNLNNRKQI